MADTGADDSTSTGKEIARIYPRPCEKVPPRGYRERSRAYIPEAVRKSTAERVQERKPRVYTRDRAEKYRRAGTVKEIARIYPRPGGKIPPRGYSEGNRAYIPEVVRKNTAARVQGKKPRVYTRDRAEKYRCAGTGKETARIYPRPCGKVPLRGYRERNRADIPETVRKSTVARVQERKPRVYTRDCAEKYRRAGIGKETARIYPRPGEKYRRTSTGGRLVE